MATNAQKIESLLFFINQEIGKKKLSELAGISLDETEEAIDNIREDRKDSGIVLVETATTVSFGTHPECAKLIESVNDAETTAPLSKAALETLSIVIYKAPISRPEIDTIRGVNSLYSVRNLLIRGLVSRRTIEGSVVYEPTSETLQLLGVTKNNDMPDYHAVLEKIDAITKQENSKQDQEESKQEGDQEIDESNEEGEGEKE